MIGFKIWKIFSEAKIWTAKKEDIIEYWEKLNPSKIIVDPINKDHKGSTFSEDGIRITGEPKFIYSVLSHLKEFLNFEDEKTSLIVKFKETKNKNSKKPFKKSYSFYIQVKNK